MNDDLNALALFLITGYLCGSVPVAFLSGKFLKNVDIRKEGSGNIGASNAFRVLGPWIGALVMAADIFKGFFPTYLAGLKLMHGDFFEVYLLAVGAAAVTGHMFPVFLNFRGGKGVATTGGVFLALAPRAAGLCVALWIVIVAVSRIASAGSLAAAVVLPFAVYYIEGASVLLTVVSFFMASIVIVMHRKNIKNLMAGSELKIIGTHVDKHGKRDK